MADAPSGGSSWGPFEIILGLLLAIGLLSNISGKPITPVTETKEKKSTEQVSNINNSPSKTCGLSVTEPISMQNVSTSVRLSGSVNGCSWKNDGSKALYAQVINGAGVPVSDFVTVESDPNDILKTSFSKDIVITTPATGTGYLLLVPAISDPANPITVRIPIKFVRN